MANETLITIVGNLTGDPELRYAGQTPVASFTIASTPRRFNKDTNDWVDEETLFLRGQVWRDQAENLASSGLVKGTRVIAQGFLKQRTFETKEGERKVVVELDVQEIGAVVPRTKPNAQRAGQPGQQQYRQQGQPPQGAPQQYAPQGQTQQDSWQGAATGYDPELPF